jgi:RNA polymerase sigma factor (sigma-70 family)
MKEFDIQVKVRNNLLVQRREQMGWSPRELAEKIGIGYQLYLGYENIKHFPLNKKSDNMWKPTALKIAEFWGESPEAIWPDIILSVKNTSVDLKVGEDEIGLLVGDSTLMLGSSPEDLFLEKELASKMRETIGYLNPREASIIKKRFGIGRKGKLTLDEVSKVFGVSRERINQIQSKVLRKLRHSSWVPIREYKD